MTAPEPCAAVLDVARRAAYPEDGTGDGGIMAVRAVYPHLRRQVIEECIAVVRNDSLDRDIDGSDLWQWSQYEQGERDEHRTVLARLRALASRPAPPEGEMP